MTQPSQILIAPRVRDGANRFAPKHGAAREGQKTRTYKIWNGMVARCHCKGATAFEFYGARGIYVCDRWRDFANFLADMGEAPAGMSIDRIDNQGGYEPGNCRWATRQTQNENRGSVQWLDVDGVRLTVAAWARRIGVHPGTLRVRLSKFTVKQALDMEPRPKYVKPPLSAETKKRMSEAAKAWRAAKREEGIGT